ncbi:hypothetical protein RhiJN_14990 [Ceratobasidium sp. AG-Ba]|nr:hypothetical protein RhiJN_14990 [Ceratobasidium sp. AG-Ba]
MSAVFLSYGISNIAMGFVLLLRPEALYDSIFAHYIHKKTGFHMTNVRTAPGFNNALACMTIAVGAGATRASLTGSRTAQSCITLMSLVWTIATVASCIVAPDIASATHVIAAIVDTGFTIALLYSGGFSVPELVGLGQRRTGGSSSSTRRVASTKRK